MRRTFISAAQDVFKILWEDIKDMKWAIIFFIAYFVFGKKYLHSLCPMVMITGFPCPGCGLTRAVFCLLRLDLSGAFRIHPFIYPIVIYIGLFGWNRYIRKQKTGIRLKILMLLLAVSMIVFYVWRMLKYFPGDPPMSYYSGNLLRCAGIAGRRFFVDILHFPW